MYDPDSCGLNVLSICASGGYALLTTVLYQHLKYLCSFFKDIRPIVYSSFYSVFNTDASDVCAIKITYLLV